MYSKRGKEFLALEPSLLSVNMVRNCYISRVLYCYFGE